MSSVVESIKHIYPRLKDLSQRGLVTLSWEGIKNWGDKPFRIAKGGVYSGILELFNGREYFFTRDLESFSKILETGSCKGEDAGGRVTILTIRSKMQEHYDEDGNYVPEFDQDPEYQFDLQEYSEGTDGFAASLEDQLRSVGFKGTVEQFYSNVLGIITSAVEESPKEGEEISIDQQIALPDSNVKAKAVCQFNRDRSLFRIMELRECRVTVNGEPFNLANPIMEFYVEEYRKDNKKRFMSEYETSMLEIAKRLKRRK